MVSEQRGLTLVELLIVLVVLSLISLGTVTALRTIGSTQERLSETTTRVDELRQISQFLRSSLRQAVVPPQSAGGATWAIPRPGLPVATRDEVVWLAPFDSAGLAGLTFFRLYREGDTLRLQLRVYRDEFDHAAWPLAGEGEVLVDGLEEFSIAYRLAYDDAWQTSLVEEDLLNRLPVSLRIVIKADGRYWPDIVVSPDQAGVL